MDYVLAVLFGLAPLAVGLGGLMIYEHYELRKMNDKANRRIDTNIMVADAYWADVKPFGGEK